jgi:hypothetical protein
MNLSCPKCNSEDTRKLTLVMSEGGSMEKGAQLGMSYGLNIMLPVMSVIIGLLMGLLFGLMFGSVVGLIAFAGTVYGGFALRKRLKAKTKPKYADLPVQMKERGFQCNRCEHLFIPA